MSAIKRFLLIFLSVLIALCSFILPASAASTGVNNILPINLGNPIENGYDGYFSVPFRTDSGVYLKVVYWKFFRTNTVGDISNNDAIVSINFISDTSFTVTFDSLVDDPIGVYCSEMDSSFNSNSLDNAHWDIIDFDDSFTISFGVYFDDSYFLVPQHYSPIYNISIPDNIFIPSDSYSIVWNNNDTYNQLSEILGHFDNLLRNTSLTNQQFTNLLFRFSELLDVSRSISGSLDDFVYYYFDTFIYDTFPNSINAIVGRLDSILRALNKTGDSEQTTVDTSNIDNYVDIEQSLVHNDEAESAINDMDVSISGKAYSFIWNLITRVLNSHSEVFGLVIAILTLGFIALLLNR